MINEIYIKSLDEAMKNALEMKMIDDDFSEGILEGLKIAKETFIELNK